MPSAAKTHVDLMFRSFADPVRLRILAVLREGELCVCDLRDVLKLPQPTVSRHLAYLRRAGLVSVRQQRSWNFYKLSPARTTVHSKLLECLASCFSDVPEMTADRRRVRSNQDRGGCCPS